MDQVIEGYKILNATINQTTLIEVGLITASIAIYDKLVKNQSKKIELSIRLSWICFAISILLGLYCGHFIGYFLIGVRDEGLGPIKVYSTLHFLSFFIGIIFIIRFGWLSIEETRNALELPPKPNLDKEVISENENEVK